MSNKKSLLENELSEVNNSLAKLENKKITLIQERKEIEYFPIIRMANDIMKRISSEVDKLYENDFNFHNNERHRIISELNKIKISMAKDLWHPVGTKVYLHGKRRYSNTYFKTDKTGTVQIFDGSQQLSDKIKWYTPNIGDVVVFHNKKDGSMGKEFTIMTDNGKLKQYAEMWLTESETPECNLLFKK